MKPLTELKLLWTLAVVLFMSAVVWVSNKELEANSQVTRQEFTALTARVTALEQWARGQRTPQKARRTQITPQVFEGPLERRWVLKRRADYMNANVHVIDYKTGHHGRTRAFKTTAPWRI